MSLRGVEALSEPYEYELELWCDDPDADLGQTLGADCELTLDRNGLVRTIFGIVAEVELRFAAELRVERAGIGARVKVVPAFALLQQEVDTRFFSGRSAIEILGELLGERLAAYDRKLDVGSRIKGSYNRRDYCVQFRESTFAFCSRLMEAEGIAYLFVADGEQRRERMVLVDNNEDFEPAELLLPERLPFERDRPDELDRESIQAFHWRTRPTPNQVVTRGYNYKLPHQYDEGQANELEASRHVLREHYLGSSERQIVDDPQTDPNGNGFDGGALAQQVPLARRVLEALRVEGAVGEGRSNAVGFAPGAVFELDEAPASGPRRRAFVLIRVEHSGAVSEGVESTDDGYANRFSCIARDQPYRPPHRTPKPRVFGVLTGVVVGPAGESIHTDALGRIRVALHVHRHANSDEHASCWIRVAQMWAGPGYGSMVIPRVGMEVVVSFIDGDPDRPLVTGCVYSGANTPPFELPSERSKSTFKTSASAGGDGYSELRVEDAAGREQVFVRAERRMDLRVHGTMFHTCNGSREEIVGSRRGGVAVEGCMQNISVYGERSDYVELDRIESVHGSASLICAGSLGEASTGERRVWSKGNIEINAPMLIHEASDTISHQAGYLTLAGSYIASMIGGERLVLESNNSLELRVGQSFIALTPEGVDIRGPTLRLNSGGGVGHASDTLPTQDVLELPSPYEALPADDGRPGSGGGHGGGGAGRRGQHKIARFERHEAPPIAPTRPPSPNTLPHAPDGTVASWDSIAWRGTETWCSEEVVLEGQASYPAGTRDSAYVLDAADGSVVCAVPLTLGQGSYAEPVTLCDILPRATEGEYEASRELNAQTRSGVMTEAPIRLRFVTDLPQLWYGEGGAMFDVSVGHNTVMIGNTIPYVRGEMGWIFSLGDCVPEGTGGLIGGKIDGTTDWRYAKEVWKAGESSFEYWDGEAWKPVPKTMKNPLGAKRIGIGIWKEGKVVKTQYGRLAWPAPDEISDWDPYDVAFLEGKKDSWRAHVIGFWSGVFDLKRNECQGYEPTCCRHGVVCLVDLQEVTTIGANTIVIGVNDARANSRAWSISALDRTVVHEFGHHLGNPDEYPGAGTVDPTINGDGAKAGIDKESIMGNGETPRRRHYGSVCKALSALVERELGKHYTYSAVEPLE